MDRREFLQISSLAAAEGLLPASAASADTTAAAAAPFAAPSAVASAATEFYVALGGDDRNPGSAERPFVTVARAQAAIREAKRRTSGPLNIWLREGTHYLGEPLVFTAEDSGAADAPITYAACGDEAVTLSGGRRLDCRWEPFRDGIFQCALPELRRERLRFTQLFVNGKRQTRARYPNAVAGEPLSPANYLEVANATEPWPPTEFHFDPATFSRKEWKNPRQAVVHLFPLDYWGNLQWEVAGVDRARNKIQLGWGGFQLNEQVFGRAATGIGKSQIYSRGSRSRFFVENVFEELDAPGEWFFDGAKSILYYMPAPGVTLSNALVEVPLLDNLIEFRGSQRRPVEHITLSGFRIAHTASTFLNTYEAPSAGDWTLHRGGAVLLEGTEHCAVENCFFDAAGGNAIFVNNSNRFARVSGNTIAECGDSAVCLAGSQALIQGTNRPLPSDTLITNNLIHDCGAFGKQVAGVFLSVSERATISHNLIYNMPRAAICVNDGWGGGHTIEFNHIHDTVRETTDHGPFNSWGRGRFWCMEQSHGDASHGSGYHDGDADYPFAYPEADGATTVIRNNLFAEPTSIHQLGIDLDDGSSHYHIYNNVCLGIAIKLREGDYRTVENNIFLNPASPPAFNQGYERNHDRFVRNIIVANSKIPHGFGHSSVPGDLFHVALPPANGPIAAEIDYNLFYNDLGEFFASVTPRGGTRAHHTLAEWQRLGYDQHSLFADPGFVDPSMLDLSRLAPGRTSEPGRDALPLNFALRPDSPAHALGFREFDLSTAGLLPGFPPRRREPEAS